jgi:hypothetical protein
MGELDEFGNLRPARELVSAGLLARRDLHVPHGGGHLRRMTAGWFASWLASIRRTFAYNRPRSRETDSAVDESCLPELLGRVREDRAPSCAWRPRTKC